MDDLASLVAGVKEVVYACVKDRAETRVMEELCADLKLERIILGPAKPASAGGVDVLIGSNTRKLRRAAKYYDQPGSFEWGAALDYPECCVRSYVQWRFLPRRRDLVAFIYAATPAGRPISFLLNNVYNFYSRLFEKDDGSAYGRFCGLNSGFDREPVLPWHPCSYACPASLAGGRRIFEVMERYMPGLAAARRETLSKPVLFKDKYLFAANQNGSNTNPYYVEEYQQFDLSVTYQFNDRWSAGFEAINLTGEDVRWHARTEKQMVKLVDQSPRYMVGLRYTF